MALDQTWITEAVDATGTAFSLKGTKLHEETTPFQKIEIFDTETFGKLMLIDGCTMVSTRDNFLYHEMMSHPALNSHPQPRRVAVIGGGDCGTLREVLKHGEVESAIQIEIDERVTRLSEQYFPELCDRNADPRARLFFGDGVAWMKDAPAGGLDVIIIDSTDPVGVAEGLFGRKFYVDCFRALAPGGIMVQQSESPLLHAGLIQEMHEAMREVGFTDTRLLSFPQPIYPSGWWSGSLAFKGPGALVERLDADAIAAMDTLYYNAEMHRAAFATPNFMKARLGLK